MKDPFRVAVLVDIHGNYYALQAVLDRLGICTRLLCIRRRHCRCGTTKTVHGEIEEPERKSVQILASLHPQGEKVPGMTYSLLILLQEDCHDFLVLDQSRSHTKWPNDSRR